MNPSDIGLPDKFGQFRKSQFEAAVQIASTDRRFVLDAMPTGAGKSMIYLSVAQMLEARTIIYTANKDLQYQLTGDYGSIGLVDIRGQNNYPCVLLNAGKRGTDYRCDKGPCHFGTECDLHPRHPNYHFGCHYYDAVRRVRHARLAVTNYDYGMSANRYMEPGTLGSFDLLVCDEAHEAPDKLAEFCSVRITIDECGEFMGGALPPVNEGVEAWVEWAGAHKRALTTEYEAAKGRTDTDPDYLKRMFDVISKLAYLAVAHVWQRGEPSDPDVSIPGASNDWVGEKSEDGDAVIFSPVWAHKYAEPWLFAGIKRIVLVSATLLPRTAHYLGIPEDQYDYREHTSGFAVERRPVYSLPTASLNYNSSATEIRAVAVKMDQIIGTRSDRKGIIQVPSYDLAFKLRQASQQSKHIMWHKRHNAREVIDQFRRAPMGTYIISPVLHQGYDFPYEQCEVIIIPKLPFPSTQSAVMKARARSDKKYLNYLTALKLVQQSGRGMRADDDRCETFILDGNMGWFHPAAKGLLPKWFKLAMHKIYTLPTPAPKLPARTHRSA